MKLKSEGNYLFTLLSGSRRVTSPFSQGKSSLIYVYMNYSTYICIKKDMSKYSFCTTFPVLGDKKGSSKLHIFSHIPVHAMSNEIKKGALKYTQKGYCRSYSILSRISVIYQRAKTFTTPSPPALTTHLPSWLQTTEHTPSPLIKR